MKKHRTKYVALQELWWEDLGTTKTSQTRIFNGECEYDRSLGTGFAVHKSIIRAVKNYKDINQRLSTLNLKTYNFGTILIKVLAPTEEKDKEVREYFHVTLARCVWFFQGNF